MRVAIAAENESFDRNVFAALLSLTLQQPIEPWADREIRFSGWPSVLQNARPFLIRAATAGVAFALIAIDNDGGAAKHPPHQLGHDASLQAADRRGCRFCLLESKVAVPQGMAKCLAVPVQCLETWLLVARGDDLLPSPERAYHRPHLKKRFWRTTTKPHDALLIGAALTAWQTPGALERLRQRPSFMQFESQVVDWAG